MKTTLQSLLKNITLRRRSPISSTRLSNLSSPFNLSPFYPSLTTFHDYSNSIIPHSSSDIIERERNRNDITERKRNPIIQHEYDDPDEVISEWEDDDDESNPEYGDGGGGGGITLQNVPWGETVLSIAQQVLLQFPDDVKIFAFKTTPSYYIYVRLTKLTHEYGCPDIREIERFNREFVERLEEEGSKGKIPDSFAVEISSPGANRLLKVPDDLLQFKDFPMQVWYLEEGRPQVKTGLFFIESIDTETEHCVWKLADVQENRESECKGKPLNRKQRDWKLKLPYTMVKKVALRCRDGT